LPGHAGDKRIVANNTVFLRELFEKARLPKAEYMQKQETESRDSG